MTREQQTRMAKGARAYMKKAGIVIREDENIEVIDFGLGQVEKMGLQLCVYVNTSRVCAKEMALFPCQTCAEHWHVPTNGGAGKEETFRCRYGRVYLYVEGEGRQEAIHGILPDMETSVYHEVVLNPGQQYTIMPGVKHWFQAGEDGAVISEFSTTSTDETDEFTDKRLIRAPKIEG